MSTIQYQIQQQSQHKNKEIEDKNKELNFKYNLFRISVVLLSLPICILVIYVLSISVDYFSFLFSLTNQLTAKLYLSSYYLSYMALLYITIIGFVIIVANTAVFQFQFSQKKKILYLHLVYFISFLVSGIINRSLSDYNSTMELLSTQNILSVNCTSRQYSFECTLSSPYIEYNSKVQTFFIVQTIFILIFIIIYHLGAINELNKFEKDQIVKQSQSLSQKYKNQISNNQNTFVSEVEFN